MKKSLYIYSHLGMGDMIICSGIVRQKAKEYDLIVVPCGYHNLESANYLYHDLDNVCVRAVIDDGEAQMFGNHVWKGEKLYLGVHGAPPFNHQIFDQEFYRQANLSFQLRWDNFFVKREPIHEIEESGLETFIHDDPHRGMLIRASSDIFNIYRPRFGAVDCSRNIFAYIPILQRVSQIHCINSSFALLVDSIDLPQKPKLFLHAYARQGEMPTFIKPWKILNQP